MSHCPNCSATLVGHSCKLRCPGCGYFESCSDLEPHPPTRAAQPEAPPKADARPKDPRR